MARKKTRHHSKWRIDHDYWEKLPAEKREWLAKFDDEYYRASFGKKPLHTTKRQRRERYVAQNAAARDILTATPDDVLRAIGAGPVAPNHASKHLEPSDYPAFRTEIGPTQLDGALVAAHDGAGIGAALEGADTERVARPDFVCKIKRIRRAS